MNLFVLYNKETNRFSIFILKSFSINRKPPLSTLANTKKRNVWRNLLFIQNEAILLVPMRSKELWSVLKVTPLSNLTQMASSGVKTYSDSRTELGNLQKEKWRQFLSSERRNAWMFHWILQELKEYARKTCGCGQHWWPFDSSFEWKERRSATVKTVGREL